VPGQTQAANGRRCGDTVEFGVHLILSNPLKYSSLKILYHDGEFLI
jgi:hypothetical protein